MIARVLKYVLIEYAWGKLLMLNSIQDKIFAK